MEMNPRLCQQKPFWVPAPPAHLERLPRAVITGVWQAGQQVGPRRKEIPRAEMDNIKDKPCYLDSLCLGRSLLHALK